MDNPFFWRVYVVGVLGPMISDIRNNHIESFHFPTLTLSFDFLLVENLLTYALLTCFLLVTNDFFVKDGT